MHFEGLVIAVVTFIIIGLFHPIVIKAEFHMGTRCWPLFAVLGLLTLGVSIFVSDTMISAILAVLACSFFWSILELFEQKKRVEKGWFPKKEKQ